MKTIFILIISLITIPQIHAESEVHQNIDITQKEAAKKLIGIWTVTNVNNNSKWNDHQKKMMTQITFTFTDSEFVIKMKGKEEERKKYVIKHIKKDILTLIVNYRNKEKEENIKFTKDSISFIYSDVEIPMTKIEK
ncbi:hypothetical protein LNTAR_06214 [Lentisphaera araneosa HTCC2155]|uniref:Uncharacterized protein n=1 Tax=Lentisphaera araneosa HTCC2155 TaxID=313628 RepID=A6DN69_9BACT|nr:hypothetical protein [Lentisphaera araneosa]EDM26817.1 hypothetical protein LNTAR_06214 [Lentisphaera araneosa HTCC2155]